MQDSSMYRQWQSSHIGGANAAYVDELYESYLIDPNSVPEDWRVYFEKLPSVDGAVESDVPHSAVREHFLLEAKNRSRVRKFGAGAVSSEHERRQVRVLHLIAAYRNRGHQMARLDPLGIMEREAAPDLELAHHGLSKSDLDTVFQTGNLFIGKPEATLREIVDCLQGTYCSTVGAEYMHIVNTAEKRWLQQRLEGARSHPQYGEDIRKHILERLTAAEGLEKYLGSRYPGTKRFGLEGGESLIPLMDEMIQRVGSYGGKELVIGMAHRGRLNVLVNTLGKSPRDLFGEFEGKSFNENGSGDVKYHQGFSSNVQTSGGEVHLAMAFNPSHLEIVSPVVEGSVRARQDRRGDQNGDQVVPILIHGDAAFAGQGVVMETFQMSQTRGFHTGGSMHIIINNQVGFTTSRRDDARSTEYCTDVAKMVQAPIFHVNADDPEAVYFVTQLAVDYRMQFKKDVVIDLICYRRLGHNEADEPSATQPLMYKKIKSHPTTRTLYAERLVNESVLAEKAAQKMVDDYRDALDEGNHVVKALVREPNKALFVDWSPYIGHAVEDDWDTGYPLKKLQDLANRLETIPEGVVIQRQVKKIIEDRRKMTAGAMALNWGYGETLAYASLLDQGFEVRLTGQDSGRGTFSHRHAVVHNQKNGELYVPLQNLYEGQPTFEIYDTLLSEEAVLGFEYGYSTTTPKALVVWEAQFGDFANGAQVVIDQFISSGEAKWGRLCGLTLLLPHGYEGQGPEHSSARLERFLQLCAEHNMQVCVPSTPSQIYHLLRRQAVRPLRKPLVIMSPKSLLRHKRAISSLEDLSDGRFQTVLDNRADVGADQIKRVVMCSGKVFYDLLEKREADDLNDTALVRIEQLYPFPEQRLQEVLESYPNLETLVWCQEEPMNQGAWYCSQHHMFRVARAVKSDLMVHYAGRDMAAAPAAGSMSLHVEQQQRLVEDAFQIK
ncbi:2-oxoglutarate dehydrogenase E1 component [Alcanivorax sp. N3-2A]|nr:2-oxoglutarate dehydrogenase E1 component [Alcanivorax sp. N3-2A]|tara:strand:+ start:5838 stop:8675 length:2838 start_codon:yes stop_codon:yes gene_type:complete